MTSTSPRAQAVVRIAGGLFILWAFGWNTVGARLRTEVSGTVVASRDVPSAGVPRYATEYAIRQADGSQKTYWAGATDASLARSMPVGTLIEKKKWRLDYERDGRRVGFPWIFYGLALAAALGVFIWGIISL